MLASCGFSSYQKLIDENPTWRMEKFVHSKNPDCGVAQLLRAYASKVLMYIDYKGNLRAMRVHSSARFDSLERSYHKEIGGVCYIDKGVF